MPEGDALLAELPAQVDDNAVPESGEVDQPSTKVLDGAAQGSDLFEARLKALA